MHWNVKNFKWHLQWENDYPLTYVKMVIIGIDQMHVGSKLQKWVNIIFYYHSASIINLD